MDARLDQLDAELREAEEAMAALEQQVTKRKSRSPRRQLGDSTARAAPATSLRAVRSHSGRNRPHLRRRDGSPIQAEDTAIVHIKLSVPEGSAALGLAFGRGAEGSGIVVTDILDESPAMSWNLYHLDIGRPEQTIRAGDAVVEVSGIWVHTASDLERGLLVAGDCVELQLLRCSLAKTTFVPSGVDHVDGRLPGRCCRAVDAPAAVPVKERVLPSQKSSNVNKSCSFGKEQRFPDLMSYADDGTDPCACVSDHFLSTKPSVSSAIIPPLRDVEVKKMAQRAKKKQLSTLSAYARGPGLRSVHASVVSLIREGTEALLDESASEASDEISTHASSDALDGLSILSGVSSDAWPSVPGPGEYEPNYKSVSLSSTKGVPSFGRYAPREILGPKKTTKPAKPSDPSECTGSVSHSDATIDSRVLEGQAEPAVFAARAKGGMIAPLPVHTARCPSALAHDAITSSKRPFYDVLSAQQAMDPAQPCSDFAKSLDTGRLKSLQSTDDVGPGAYELKVLAPNTEVPTARIGPGFTGSACDEGKVTTEGASGPGPADYDALEALEATLPRSFAADMGRPPPEPHPQPLEAQSALSPRWELLCPRIPSTTIYTPLVDPALLPPEPRTPGPGAYQPDSSVARRIRDGMSVQHWQLPSSGLVSGVPEHERGLYDARPVDRSIRGDPRPLLDPDAGSLTYRRKFRAFMRYQQDAPVLVDRRWRFYDLGGSPEPLGLAEFANRLTFDDFQGWQMTQARREVLAARRMRPSLALAAYSLPSLDVVKESAPRALNFDKVLPRDAGDVSDSPREGDVLHLSLDAEEALHPRVISAVNMSKQMGRSRSAPPDLTGDDINDEELLLSPRHAHRRVPTFVDMTKGGREPLTFSADIWATQNGVVYTYRRTSNLNDAEGEALELDVNPRAPPRASDFGLPLGRPGHDPRTVDPEEPGKNEEELMLHWRPVAPRPTQVAERVHAERNPPVTAVSAVLHSPDALSDAPRAADAEG